VLFIPYALSFCQLWVDKEQAMFGEMTGDSECAASLRHYLLVTELFFYVEVMLDLVTTQVLANGDGMTEDPYEIWRLIRTKPWFLANVIMMHIYGSLPVCAFLK